MRCRTYAPTTLALIRESSCHHHRPTPPSCAHQLLLLALLLGWGLSAADQLLLCRSKPFSCCNQGCLPGIAALLMVLLVVVVVTAAVFLFLLSFVVPLCSCAASCCRRPADPGLWQGCHLIQLL